MQSISCIHMSAMEKISCPGYHLVNSEEINGESMRKPTDPADPVDVIVALLDDRLEVCCPFLKKDNTPQIPTLCRKGRDKLDYLKVTASECPYAQNPRK